MKFPSRRTSGLVGGRYLLNNGVCEHVCVAPANVCLLSLPTAWPMVYLSLFVPFGLGRKIFSIFKTKDDCSIKWLVGMYVEWWQYSKVTRRRRLLIATSCVQ